MQKITSVKELKRTIWQLESDQKRQAELLKIQFKRAADSLKPVNLLRSAIQDIVQSPFFLLIGIETIKSWGHWLIDKVFRHKETAVKQD